MDESVIVSAGWLADHRDDPDVRIVDVRDGWEFEGIGHVPGAVNVPFDAFRDGSDVDRGMLPGPDTFASLLSAVGIQAGDTIVAYDDDHGVFAARFVVTALEYGHADVRLLDGDYSAWVRSYEPTTDQPEVEPSNYAASPLDPDESPLIDREVVERKLHGESVFVDTRERHEFDDGHLPGAVRFDWREAVDLDTRRLRSPDEIVERLADHGITRDREIVLYCNTARRISHTYVVLRALGFEDVSFYEGSLREWLAEGGEVDAG